MKRIIALMLAAATAFTLAASAAFVPALPYTDAYPYNRGCTYSYPYCNNGYNYNNCYGYNYNYYYPYGCEPTYYYATPVPVFNIAAYTGSGATDTSITQTLIGNELNVSFTGTPMEDTGSVCAAMSMYDLNYMRAAGVITVTVKADELTASFNTLDLINAAQNAATALIGIELRNVTAVNNDGVKALEKLDTLTPVYTVTLYDRKSGPTKINLKVKPTVSVKCDSDETSRKLAYFADDHIYYYSVSSSGGYVTSSLEAGSPFVVVNK